jgi:amino acid efflux transporter
MSKALRREIGLLSLVVYYFSTIVGVGIFIVPLFAAKLAGPASLVAWGVALLCAYPFAMIFAHISQTNQVSGSIQKFLEKTWGNNFGKAMALFLVVSALFGNALLGFSAARYCNELFEIELNVFLLGCAFLWLPIFFNLMRIGVSSKIQTFALIGLVVLIEMVVITAIPQYQVTNLEPFAPNGWGAILPAVMICFYSIVGWENVDAMAEEVKNPGKSYKKAVQIAIGVIALFYLSIAFTVVAIMDHATISSTKTVLTAILKISMGHAASKAGGVIAITLLILAANAWVLGTSRIIFALARDGILPKSIARLSTNDVPHLAVMSQMVFYSLISLVLVVLSVSEDTVVEVTSLNYLLLYIIIFFSGMKSFRNSRFKVISAVAMAIVLVLLLQSSVEKIGLCILIMLICLFYVFIGNKKRARL